MDKGYQQVELKKMIAVVFRRWWLLTILFFLFAVLAWFISSNYVKEIYKAETSLFIGKEQGALGDIGISLSDIQTYNQLIVDYKHLASSRIVIDEVIKATGNTMTNLYFRENLSVEIVDNSRFFTVSFSHHDPKLAADVANELAKQLTIAAAEIVNVENIRIVDKALVPTKAASPNIKLITLISGMLGLMIGLLIIYLLEVFDDTIKSQESIEQELGLPVIAIIPRFKGEVKR